MRGLLAELREEHTILLSTHIMQEVEAVCDRAIVIHRGKVVAAGTLDELRQARTSRQARALVRSDDPKLLRKRLRKLAGVAALTCQTDAGITELNVTFSDDSDPQVMCERLVARLVELGAGVRQVTALSASLEEVFAQLTLSEASATDQEDGDEDDGDEDDAAREDDR